MSVEQPGFTISLPAAADLSTHCFKFVTVNGSGQAALGSAGVRAVGVTQNKPTGVGQATTVMVSGITKLIAGATIVAGNEIASGANGVAAVATTGNHQLGVALNGGSSGQTVSVLLLPAPRVV